MKIVFFGTPEFSVLVLEKLLDLQKNPASHTGSGSLTVITAPDKPVGRKQTLTPSPVKEYALSHQIPVLTPEQFNNLTIQQLKDINPDLLVVAAYGKIIPQAILDIPQFGALNIHPSLLPSYRGASPLQAAILNGDKKTGVTIIKMDERMDHGPIIAQREFNLDPTDTYITLGNKLFLEGANLLIKTIPDFIEGKIKPVGQRLAYATYCPIIKKEDGYFDTNNISADVLDRMVRAYYPWPTAWTRWNNKVVKFLPGKMLQIEGKKPVKIDEFLRGYPAFPLKKI